MEVSATKIGQDPDTSYGPIRISHEQVQRSPDEISDFTSNSSQRRRREIIANFDLDQDGFLDWQEFKQVSHFSLVLKWEITFP